MFIVPLDAAEPVKQVVPQVFVTVQQPAGTPEWEKTLLAAAVGALFAILGGVAMEYLKPWITKQRTKKIVKEQLTAELLGNMSWVKGSLAILAETDKVVPAKRNAVIELSARMLRMMNTDRFDHFFEEEKTLLYEIDDDKSLADFYEAVKTTIPGVIERGDFKDLRIMIGEAERLANQYITHHKVQYVQPKTPDTPQMFADSISKLAREQK